ncbi:MAG: GNAT family N-acetyltransferase [Chloroflexota bacterium]|nr:GNAT family N-acetyltransferase [Chloroflexota bacterium]
MHHEWRRGAYLISTDRQRLDLTVIHGFLTRAYWSTGIALEIVQRGIEHSLNFGVYLEDQQIGFARVVTDMATFAYLADVFVLEAYRGQGLGVWLVETIMAHPDLQGLRRWTLATRDAHTLYQKVGFTPLKQPERWLEKVDFDIYTRGT